MIPSRKLNYGSVWQQAADNVLKILESNLPKGKQLQMVMGLGYFSQFTSNASIEFNKLLFEWLRKYLLKIYEFDINLPNNLVELDIVPTQTLVKYSNRNFSPDLLRNIGYALQLRKIISRYDGDKLNILEIGSGYGALGRVLKNFHPGLKYWLTDISESLLCAEIYLRAAFPNSRIVWQDAGVDQDTQDADFYLVKLEDASHVLSGRYFQLAINIWSFGEMPNKFIDEWFQLLQNRCSIDWLFTINSFMAPVTPISIARINVGDWLFKLDEHWSIDHFVIDPEIHRCPLLRNFPKGIEFIARRIDDKDEINEARIYSRARACSLLQEDWVSIACNQESSTIPDRPERILGQHLFEMSEDLMSSKRLLAITDYIGHFNIDSDKDAPFFSLWDDWRMNKTNSSALLLVIYLAMVNKTILEVRCAKEELLLLNRVSDLPIHSEYAAFISKSVV